MNQVIIGVDPHKLSATIEVVDRNEQLLGSSRFTTDKAGYAAMRNYAKNWPDRDWAVEGANGAGRPLAQRLLESGENVVDVPAKLAARVRLFDTGHNRKTDALDAHSVAVVAVRTANLRVLKVDGELEALRMLTDRREALTRRRVQTVCRLQALLAELLPGQAKRDITTGQAKKMLASVRPRDLAGKTRRLRGHEGRQGQGPAAREAAQAQPSPRSPPLLAGAQWRIQHRRGRRTLRRRPLHHLPRHRTPTHRSEGPTRGDGIASLTPAHGAGCPVSDTPAGGRRLTTSAPGTRHQASASLEVPPWGDATSDRIGWPQPRGASRARSARLSRRRGRCIAADRWSWRFVLGVPGRVPLLTDGLARHVPRPGLCGRDAQEHSRAVRIPEAA